MTIWSVFPDTTKYFMASPSSFMANYIVDDLDALLDRLAKAGARIDPKRRGESYGCFRLDLRSRRQPNCGSRSSQANSRES